MKHQGCVASLRLPALQLITDLQKSQHRH